MPVLKTKKCEPTSDIKSVINSLLSDLGGLSKFVKAGDKVLLKPNTNTSDLFLSSSNLEFIKADCLKKV